MVSEHSLILLTNLNCCLQTVLSAQKIRDQMNQM
uniref:Uncharacterized protein n=1 Tax=Anguilla anguilla TaxID=7936 RepID=A0A0E9SUQ1_ANGAN